MEITISMGNYNTKDSIEYIIYIYIYFSINISLIDQRVVLQNIGCVRGLHTVRMRTGIGTLGPSAK